MIRLDDSEIRTLDRKSSKGNQLKFYRDGIWYKADYLGYEGFSEYVVSKLLSFSNLGEEEYVNYEPEIIRYNDTELTGCKSKDFLGDCQLVTLERLIKQRFNESLNKIIYTITDKEERLKTLVDLTERATNLKNVGKYMSKLLLIDAFFLNEDRHTHNIAVLMKPDGEYRLCPAFDHGAALLSDTRMDYPLAGDLSAMTQRAKPKTFADSFDEQLDIAEKLYGCTLRFNFKYKEVEEIANSVTNYSPEIRRRVIDLIMQQRVKYDCYFE